MKQGLKLLSLALVLVFAAALLGGCAGNKGSVGVLDVNKVMSESPKVKNFQEQLNAKGKELSDALEKEKPNLSNEEFQKRQEAAYSEFLKLKQDFESQIDAAIQQALDQVAKEKGLGVILYKNGVAQGGIDITDAVIQKMQ